MNGLDRPADFANHPAIYLELTSDAQSRPNLSIYSLDSNNNKIILGSKVFDTTANEGEQTFDVLGLDKLKIEHIARDNKSWFNVSVDATNNPLHINSAYNLDLQQAYSLHGLTIDAAKNLAMGKIRTGAKGYGSNANIKAKTCIMRDTIDCGHDLTINTDNIYMPANIAIRAGGTALLASKKDSQLLGNITAENLAIRAEGELAYELTNLHAKELVLQVAKVAQMQFPDNVVVPKETFQYDDEVKFAGQKLAGAISYELIGTDVSPIQILNSTFAPGLSIKALNNHVVVGTREKSAHLLGKRLCIDAKSIDLYHGGIVGSQLLMIQTQVDTTIGAIDFRAALAAGKPSYTLPRYIGSNLLYINTGRKLTMHNANVFVPGVMWLRAKELDNIGSSIKVSKDTYVDIERATISDIKQPLSVEDNKKLYPGSPARASVLHASSPVWLTNGTMHVSQNSRIVMNNGIIYAGKINGPLAANVQQTPPTFSIGSYTNIIATSANTQRGYQQGIWLYMDMMDGIKPIMDFVVLNEANTTESLAMVHDEYCSKTNLPIHEQDLVNSSLLFKAISKAAVNASKREKDVNKIIKPNWRVNLGMIAQLWYLRELRANAPVPVKPSTVDGQLFTAIKSGNVNAVKDAIANGARVNAVDASDDCLYNALQLAIITNNVDIAKFLAQAGNNIKFDYLTAGANPKTALDLARERGNTPGYAELISILNSKTPPPQAGWIDPMFRNSSNIAQLQAKADIEAQINVLRTRDEDILAAFYTQNTKELLEKVKGPILDVRDAWLATIEQERDAIATEQKLITTALTACVTGDNLEAILKLKNLEDNPALWVMFCACQPLELAIKHAQTKAAAYLIDNGIDYLTLLSQGSEHLEQTKNMDFNPGGMLDVLSVHMQQDLIAKMQSENVAFSKEQLSLTMTIFAQLLINKSHDIPGYDLNKNIEAKLDSYFGQQTASLEEQRAQVEEAFTKASEQYLQEIYKIINTHNDKIGITRVHYNKLLKQIIDQYNQELQQLMEEQRKARAGHAAKMQAAAKKAKKKGLRKILTVAISVGVCAVVAPQLLTFLFPNIGGAGLAIGTGALTGGVSSTVAGANRNNILKAIAGGAGGAAFGSLAGTITSNAFPNLAAAEAKLLEQMAKIAASNVPGAVINKSNYLENVAMNAGGTVLSSNLPTVNLAKLSTDEMKEVAQIVDKTANILIGATPALIGKGDTREKLLRYAGLATQLTTQEITNTTIDAVKAATAPKAPSVVVKQPEFKFKTPDITGTTENKVPLHDDLPKQTKATVTPQQHPTKLAPNNQQDIPSEPKLSDGPIEKTKTWLIMAKRALQGDTSPEVLAWQQQNRQTTPNLAKFTDGITRKEVEINQAMRQNKQALLHGVDSLIAELDTDKAVYDFNIIPNLFHTVRASVDMLVPGSTAHARAHIILPQAFRLQNIVEMFKASNEPPKTSNTKTQGGSNSVASSRINTLNKTAVDSVPTIIPPPIIPITDASKLRPPYHGPLRSGDSAIAADKDDLPNKPFVTPIAPDLGKIPGKNMADNSKLPTTFTTPINGSNKGDYVLPGPTQIPEIAKPSPFITPMYDGDKEQNFFKKGANSDERNLPPYGQRYFPAPKTLFEGINGTVIKVDGKTSVQGGGGIRPRWTDSKGLIYEWDFQEGHFEVYSKSGNKHLGAFNSKMDKIKDGDPRRRVEP